MVPVAAKAGVLLAVAAAGSTSIWYFSDSIFGKGVASVADEAEQNPYEKGPIKGHNRYFLSSKKNQKIWEERYKENQSKFARVGATDDTNTKAKDKFGTVTVGYSDTESSTTTSLNKICEDAYKLTDSSKLQTDEPTDSSSGTDKFAIPNIWKFCSIGGIVTVSEDKGKYTAESFPTTKIGGEDTNKKLFVSAKSDKNQWFWKLREEEFRKESGDRSHSKSQGKTQSENVFKKLKDGQIGTLSDACHSAYEKESNTDTTNKNKEDALTFCSIQLTITPGSQG